MYHIFFIHSFVYNNFACFHVLAILNSAAMNTGVHFFFFFLLEYNCFTMCLFLLYGKVTQPHMHFGPISLDVLSI